MVADDSLSQILEGSAKQVLEIEFTTVIDEAKLHDFKGIKKVLKKSNNVYEIELEFLEDARPEMMKYITNLGLPLIGIKQQETTMEQVFKSLTETREDA